MSKDNTRTMQAAGQLLQLAVFASWRSPLRRNMHTARGVNMLFTTFFTPGATCRYILTLRWLRVAPAQYVFHSDADDT
jgi:hypothetical protein